MWRWHGAAAGVLVLHLAEVSAATPAPERSHSLEDAMHVTAGKTCLDRRRLAAHVEMWLGSARVPSNLRVIVRGDARQVNAAEFWVARAGKVAWRKFDPIPAACDEAHAALGLAIAMAIDADALQTLVRWDRAEHPARLFTADLAAGYAVVAGLSAGAAAGIEYGFLDWLSGRSELLLQHTRNNAIAGSSGKFDATLFAGSLQACAGGFVTTELRLALCSGALAGLVHSQGRHYTVSYARTGGYLAAASGLRAEVEIGISWTLDVDFVFPIQVPRFTVERPGATDLAREPKPVGVLFGVGPAFRW